MPNPSSSPPNADSKLVQTKLTSAFFSPRRAATTDTTTSPYFTKPPSAPSPSAQDEALPQPPLDLHTERRRNLNASQPPPTLRPSTTSSPFLALIATETTSLLPPLLASIPSCAPTSRLYTSHNLHALHQHRNPQLICAPVRVFNADTLDLAFALQAAIPQPPVNSKPVLVLNMANANHAGGGWLKGALAQEESLCYRTSLSFTLKRRFYPLSKEEVVYSPRVVVIREAIEEGHKLLDLGSPEELPVVSVVSVAAVKDPEVEWVTLKGGEEVLRYRYRSDREAMLRKMRAVLRVAGREGHRRVVLGALGCGAFGNPNVEVVRLWKEVLLEEEFEGWWEKIWFAVMEQGGTEEGDGNFGVFSRGLDGLAV